MHLLHLRVYNREAREEGNVLRENQQYCDSVAVLQWEGLFRSQQSCPERRVERHQTKVKIDREEQAKEERDLNHWL